jgi:XTP/dITP diphosphohydrolase
VQADTLEEVARWGALHAIEIFKRPFIIEDSGLFVERLDGFPGPYSAYVFKTLGNKGVLKLMSRIKNRKAKFRSVIALCEPSREPVIFTGCVEGEIAKKAMGKEGFGFDPIFLYGDKTFGEIGRDEKNMVSHRRAAMLKLIRWLVEHKDVFTI